METAVRLASSRRETALGLFRSIAFALLVLAIPVTLVATNVRFAASEVRVYDYSVREYNAAAASRIPESELIGANRQLVSYFTAEDPGPLHIVVTNTNGDDEALFNARETAHLADVRDLFQGLFTVQLLALALTLSVAVVLFATSPLRLLARGLLYGALLTVALVGASGALAYLGFDSAWRQFHFLAFTNDLWELNPARDHLIQMFPRDFWYDITLLIGAFTLLEALLIGGAAGAYMYFARPDEEEEEERRPVVAERRPLDPRPHVPPPRPRHLTH
jgi:integral membrane protein (TIGR01906 family)